MKVRNEINKYAEETDKPVLNWLLDRYHWSTQWRFVAYCTPQRYGKFSYQTHHVCTPTSEGRILYNHRDEILQPEQSDES